ncbi:MAG: hypothetical protein JXA24_06905 [Proteobacteria bacterium]|nr:hypothetical protein [Pseudomonadota bacterium]
MASIARASFILILFLAWHPALLPGTAYCFEGVIIGAKPVVSCDIDTDGDGIVDCLEDANRNGIWEPELGETDSHNPDTDGDGIIDGEEGDRDGDGELGTDESDPLVADTDGDGIPDGEERRLGTMRNMCDTDGDGLSDGVEMGVIQPEVKNGCHGLMAAGTNYKNPYRMDPLNPDSDFDGLQDGEEDKNGNGWVDPDETDPSIVDTDGDGLCDYVETTGDFDGDGLPDFDFQSIRGEAGCIPPKDISDLDCDGVPNARDDDSDNDGCPDAQEGGWLDADYNGIPDIYDKDAKLCPEPASDSNSGGSRGARTEEAQSALGEGPLYPTDGGACTLVRAVNTSGPLSGIPVFSFIILMIAAFSTARPFIRQTY